MAAQGGAEPTDGHQKEQVKVDAKKHHKEADDPLAGHRIACHTVVQQAKTTGTGCAHGVDDGVKQGHSGQQQRNKFQQRQHDVDQIQDLYAVPYPRDDFIHGRAGHFRPQDMHGAVRRLGRNDGHKNQDSHTADPVGKAAPEMHGMAQDFHIGQQRGPGGGKTAYRFKKSIDIPGNGAAEIKGQRTDQRKGQPRQRHDDKAFLGEDIGPQRFAQPPQQKAAQQCNADGNQKSDGVSAFMVAKGDKRRKYQHAGFNVKHHPRGGKHNSVIHSMRPSSLMGLRQITSRLHYSTIPLPGEALLPNSPKHCSHCHGRLVMVS